MTRLRRSFLFYAAALIIAGSAYGGWHIQRNYQLALDSAYSTLTTIARSMRQQFDAWVTDGLGTASATYKHVAPHGFEDREQIAQLLAEDLSGGAYVAGAFIAVPGHYIQVERDHAPVMSAQWPDWLTCPADQEICVAVPVRTPERYFMPVIRRITAGREVHYIGTLLEVHEVQRMWRTMDLPNGRYAATREDGMPLTRAAEEEPDDLLLEPLELERTSLYERMGTVGNVPTVIEAISPFSGIDLIIAAVRADESIPVIVAAGLPREAVLAAWKRNSRNIAIVTTAGTLLLLLATALLYRFLYLLNTRELQFRQLLNQSRSSILLLRDRRVLYANAITNSIFDVPAGDTVVGKAPWEFSPPNQPGGESSQDAANERFSALDETPNLRFTWTHKRLRTSEPFESEVSLSQLRIGDHEYMLAIIQDISELMSAQRALQTLNATLEERVRERTQGLESANARLNAINAELEEFTASASHDLRSPISTISGQTSLIEAALGARATAPDVATRFSKIHAGVRRAAEVIDGLLSLAHITRQELRAEPVSLTEIATRIVAELRESDPQREVIINCEDNLNVVADARLMHSLLQNLLSNAWKYSAHARPAMIEFGRDDAGYFVRDNGMGFNMDQSARLFRAFQRLHTQEEMPGTGVGLATVARIVRRYGGRIWAHSEIGQGAIFRFTLPAASDTRQQTISAVQKDA